SDKGGKKASFAPQLPRFNPTNGQIVYVGLGLFTTGWEKFAGALKKPRPVHIKKEPAGAELFKAPRVDRLSELNIEAGKQVEVRVQDEAR
ncbi:MAG: hypothetical protein PWQ29_1602, partial [Verrucomicrobiota bacterium]|nr:hypothetical protein [Verrucomicrobiota bacterium]MDK2964208.1 hypothetical protein [Verrucomicrobiota bacterium]